jgi:hypothetical protein
MAAFRAKRRRRVRNRVLVGSGLTVGVVLAAAVLLQPEAPGSDKTGGINSADSCVSMSLEETFDDARQAGASIIVANGTLTGRTTLDGNIYYEMVLNTVDTLSGPAIAPGTAAWLDSRRGPSGPIPGPDHGPLWGPDGDLLAIALPAALTKKAVAPILRVAPVVGDQVIFGGTGCWDTVGLQTGSYSGPLAEIPGSGVYDRVAATGFDAVALATVEQLATG